MYFSNVQMQSTRISQNPSRVTDITITNKPILPNPAIRAKLIISLIRITVPLQAPIPIMNVKLIMSSSPIIEIELRKATKTRTDREVLSINDRIAVWTEARSITISETVAVPVVRWTCVGGGVEDSLGWYVVSYMKVGSDADGFGDEDGNEGKKYFEVVSHGR